LPNGSADASDANSEVAILPMTASIDLDAKCGRYLTFRDLVECGETWVESAQSGAQIDNHPVQVESIEALELLCRSVVDPVIADFGPIDLTYGFSGRELSNRVKRTVGRIAPDLDQHAAHELNTRGGAICARGGAAVDFRVQGKSSLEVARWVVSHTPFDRLYFYGERLPIHVSAAVRPIGQIVEIRRDGGGSSPNVRSREYFLGRERP
jgi:hypothetical protein